MQKFIYLIILSLSLISCASSEKGESYSESQKAVDEVMGDGIRKADSAFIAGDYANAAVLYRDNIVLDRSNEESLFNFAESLRLSGNTQEAVKIYDKIIEKNPSSLNAMEGKSLCYVKEGDFKKAALVLDNVIKADAARWRAINALGVIHAATGRKEDAMKYYKIALDLSKNNPAVLNNMGLSVAFDGDTAKGIELLEQAKNNIVASEVKKRELVDYNLALVYGISGNMEKSRSILAKYLSEPQVLNNLGYYAKLANDDKMAKSYLTKALAQSPVYYERAANNMRGL